MRASGVFRRHDQGAFLPYQFVQVIRNALWRQENPVVVVKSEKTPVEQPVRCSSERDAVANGVWTVHFEERGQVYLLKRKNGIKTS